MTDYIKTHWNKYMNHQALDNLKKKEVTPQLVTAASSNHFVEFREHAKAMRKHFPGEKMVVYDLGLSDVEIKWIKEGPDHDLFIYKKFDFSQYPWHVQILSNFAWKIMIWMEMFQNYDAIQYFDSSIWFIDSSKNAINAKIYNEDSCWVYFIKEAGHDISSHTHPGMFNFFPSDYWKMIDMLN